MLDPETIIAIEAIVNRLLDEREAQKAEFAQRTAKEVQKRMATLLQEAQERANQSAEQV